MILKDKTIQKYGYDPIDLEKKSKKIVIAKCDECGKIFEKQNREFFRRKIQPKTIDCSFHLKCYDIIDGARKCIKCELVKPLEFFDHKIKGDVYSAKCKACKVGIIPRPEVLSDDKRLEAINN